MTADRESLNAESLTELRSEKVRLEKKLVDQEMTSKKALIESEARLLSILDNTTAVIYVKDLNGRLLLINKMFEKLFHVSRAEILGKTDFDLFPEADATAFQENDRSVLAAAAPLEFEETAPHDDGPHTYISIKFPLFDSDRKIYAVCGISTDITERKRAEMRIRETLEYLEKIINAVADPIFVKDRQHRWVLLNDACCALIGYRREQLLGKSDYDFFSKKEADVFRQIDEEVFTTGRETLSEESFTDGVGVTHTIHTKKTLYVDGRGDKFIVGIIRDITELKRAEEAKARLAAIVETSDDAIMAGTLDGKILTFNSGAKAMFGFAPEEVLGRSAGMLIPAERSGEPAELLKRVAGGEHIRNYETVALHKDGRRFDISVTLSPVLEAGQITGVSAIIRDVTEQKKAQRVTLAQYAVTKIIAEAPSLKTAAPAVLRAICENLDWDMGILWRVDKVTQQLRCVEVWFSDDSRFRDFEASSRQKTFAPGVGLPGRVWKSGEPAWIQDVVADKNFPRSHAALLAGLHAGIGFPICVGGAITGVMEFFRRRTCQKDEGDLAALGRLGNQIGQFIEHKLSQDELVEKSVELARSNAQREQLELFAYVASHDLQEPLQKILAFGGLLKDYAAAVLDEKARDYIDRMSGAAQRLSRLIDDLLKFSKIATGQEPFVNVELSETLRDVLADLELRIQKTGARVEIGDLPAVRASQPQMRALFQNLIGNAIKFHRPGERPQVAVQGEVSADGWATITVADNGIGIDVKYLQKIFRPFERLHAIDEYEGTGIGLAICQKIVARHKGSISVKSKVGEGSVFILRLPAEPKADKL